MRELSVTEQDSVSGGCLDLLHSLGFLLKLVPLPRLHLQRPNKETPPLTIANNYGVIIGQVNGNIGHINGFINRHRA